MTVRVVFDSNTVISALLFESGQLSWLRNHWREGGVVALVSRATVEELIRVLAYPKFKLDKADIEVLLADYLPYTRSVAVSAQPGSPRCSDPDDQVFVDLALQGQAQVLVTRDRALLAMDLGMRFEKTADYRRRLKY